jgi:cytochrome c-type biogenesis protein CcmH
MTPTRAFVLLLLPLLAALTVPRAFALTEEEVERRVLELSDELRCPTCQALSVKDSEASFSVQIRDKVRRMVREGQSDEAVKAFFVARYGEWILRAPKKEGIGLLLWVLPFTLILLGGGLLVWHIRRRGAAAPAAPAAALSAEQRDAIQRDLKRFREED